MYVVRTGGTETIPICQLSTDDYPVLGYNIQYNIYWGLLGNMTTNDRDKNCNKRISIVGSHRGIFHGACELCIAMMT